MKTRYVDLDGTLAFYDVWRGPTVIGNPIPRMVQKVKGWLSNGDKVIVFTTRISPKSSFTKPEECAAAKKAVEEWCVKYIGVPLEVTSEKGFFDIVYDDKAEHIVPDTGKTSEETLLETILSLRKTKNSNDTGILDWIVRYLVDNVERQNE